MTEMINLLHKPLKILLTAMMLLVIFSSSLEAQQAKTYDEAIILADKQLKQGHLLDAKAYYQMALKFKKNDSYAKQKMEEIVQKLKVQMDNEDKYYDIIDRADDFFDQNALDAAKTQYLEALKIIPDDDYAKNKIAQIDRLKKEEKEKRESFKKAMEQGEEMMSKHNYAKALELFQKARDLYPAVSDVSVKISEAKQLLEQQQINTKLADEQLILAERYLLIKNYAEALKCYKKADSLLPETPKILLKIKEIEPKAKRQLNYDKLTAEADNLYIAKNYMAAKKKYEEASKWWPDNTYPSEMIAKIDEQLNEQKKHLEKNYHLALHRADSLFERKEYDNAKAEYNLALTLKPDESYPSKQIQAIEAYFAEQKKKLEENYQAVVATADSLFNSGHFDEAEEKYRMALGVKPADPYPAKQLEALASARKKREEEEKANLKYQQIIAEADRLYDNGQYDLAIKKYNEAQVVKSSEIYPEQKIKKIKEVLANLAKQKELDEKYNNQIILATRLLQEEKYEDAKKAFHNALTFKPDATLPKIKIAQADSLIAVKAEQQRIDAAYQAKIHKADSLLKEKNYEQALENYTAALSLKPDDAYAKKQQKSVTTTMAALARKKKLEESYKSAIANADHLLADKKYELAKVEYRKALGIKAQEKYPRQKIAEIDKKLQELEKEKEQRYLQAMSKADNLFAGKNYSDALIQYKVAASIKPEAAEPQQKIENCNAFIEEQNKKLKTQYNLAVADADKFYAAKIYDRAIQAYKHADEIKPDETYPEEMIARITKFIEDNAVVDLITDSVIIKKGETKKLTFEPLPIKVRKYNYILVRAKNLSGKAFKVLFNFGSTGKNGGFVVQVPADSTEHDFIIRVGNQYKWFSEDNKWLTIYPEGGDFEISLLRISKSN